MRPVLDRFYLHINVRHCRAHPLRRAEYHEELVYNWLKIPDKLFPGDSKRVPSPWNCRMLAAFHALFAT